MTVRQVTSRMRKQSRPPEVFDLPDVPYALLVYGSLNSFGEVVVLLEFAEAIRSRFRSVFLSLDSASPKGAIIERAGHQSLFFFREERLDDSVSAALLSRPPQFCVASDYSQFNVYRANLAKAQAGESLMRRLAGRFGIRSAVTDLLGLSFECSMRLRKPYSAILVPASGYQKVLSVSPDRHPHVRVFSMSARPARTMVADENNFDERRPTVFVSYPRPHGWQADAAKESAKHVGDPFAALWVRCVERGLAKAAEPINIVTFSELKGWFSPSARLTTIPNDASVTSVNKWLSIADVVVTPNFISTLAARAASHGAQILVSYNDLAWDRYRHPRRRPLEIRLRRTRAKRSLGRRLWSVATGKAFDDWLPGEVFSCWPGVDATLTGMVKNARGIPLFQPSEIARAIRRKTATARKARGQFPVHSCLAIAHELAGAGGGQIEALPTARRR